MNIKGLDQLHKHLPDMYTTLGVLRYFLIPIILFFLARAFLITDGLTEPFWLLASEIVLGSLGFLLLYLFFQYKEEFKARFGPLAYSRAASRFGLPAVAITAAVIARIRSIPGPEIPHVGWSIVLPVLGWTLIALGVLLSLRAVQTFGLDNLIMLYVYFPDESRLVDHRIYNILRHPAYTAVQYIAFGLALLNGSWFALTSALIFAFSLWTWVRFVEEKELIERFGPAYVGYRQRVPAFLPRLRDLRGFFGFLIFGK